VTESEPTVAATFDFREPFIGHLPGYRAAAELAAPGPLGQSAYEDFLMLQWQALLDSPESRDERLLHQFLERHPSLLPGPNSVDGTSGHFPFPIAAISRPKLPGLSDREPDFMWIAADSAAVYPILIEIETPHKQWFYGDRAEIHSEFTHAQGQLAEWRAWFSQGGNRTMFLDAYDFPDYLRKRRLSPRYVLIYGRQANYAGSPLRQAKRSELAREDERLMSFDRLTPSKWADAYSCVRKTVNGYQVVAVPPSLTIINTGETYRCVEGWQEALDHCPDMPTARCEYLQMEIGRLIEDPHAYVETRGRLRTRTPRWL